MCNNYDHSPGRLIEKLLSFEIKMCNKEQGIVTNNNTNA